MLNLFAAVLVWGVSSAELSVTETSPHVATMTLYNDVWDVQGGLNGPMTIVQDGIAVTFEVLVTPNGNTNEGDIVTILNVSPGYYAKPTEIKVPEGGTAKIEIFEWVVG